jgi:hypothetical protein
MPQQLPLGSSFGLVPENMGKKPASLWLEPFRRAIRVDDCKRLFPSLDQGEGVPEVAVHQALISDVLRGLRQADVQVGPLFTDHLGVRPREYLRI